MNTILLADGRYIINYLMATLKPQSNESLYRNTVIDILAAGKHVLILIRLCYLCSGGRGDLTAI